MKKLRVALLENRSWIEIFLASTLVFILLAYAFFFLIAPQHWSLIDHYAHALKWGTGDFDPIQEADGVIRSLMTFGRFRPIDITSWMIRYKFLPVSPRAFHAEQFALMLAMFLSLGNLVFRSTKSAGNTLFALVLAVGAFSFKDWIFHTSAGDPLATTFLITSFALYAADRKWLAAGLFSCAFLTKESYFVFVFCFAVLEFFTKRKRDSIQTFLPLISMFVGATAFVLFVRSLPQIYAAGFGLGNLSFTGAARAYLIPVLKSFFPAFLLVAYTVWKNGRNPIGDDRKRLLALGASIVGIYTLFMVLWGPFDSWFYMHIPIPFGWAMIFSALWFPRGERDTVHGLLLVGAGAFLFLSVLNGSRNFYTYFGEAKVVARIACDDAKRTPGLKIFINCNEGALQLRNYLILDRVCEGPPEFIYLNGKGLPDGTAPPYEVVWSDRCDPMKLESIAGESTLSLEWWKIRRNLSIKTR